MSEHFIILGLPRSMTAWVSCFLTCGDVFCQHELSGRFPIEDISGVVRDQPFPISGICDSGLSQHGRPFVEKYFPNARVAIISRMYDDCVDSLEGIGLSHESADRLCGPALNGISWFAKEQAERFTFDELQTEEGARRLWEYVAPYVPLPPAHLAKMMTLKVTVHPKVYTEAAAALNALTAA